MFYSDILNILKMYPFEEKMKVCFDSSANALRNYVMGNYDELRCNLLTTELEQFIMLSLKSGDEGNGSFHSNDGKESLRRIFDVIRINEQQNIKNRIGNLRYFDYLMPTLLQMQTTLQREFYVLYYRFHYMFNFKNSELDMHEVFLKHYSVEYDEYILLGYIIVTLCYIGRPIDNKLLTYLLVDRFRFCVNHLSITKDEYIQNIDKFAHDVNEYSYCIRPSYLYPFIKHDNVLAFPLPHIIVQSTTTSMLYTLTSGNNALQEKLGLHVLQKYLHCIISDSQVFDEVHEECPYISEHKNRCLSLDILCRSSDNFVFFDSKSYKPKSKIRLQDDDAIYSDITRLAEMVVQIYHHLVTLFPHKYNPFGHYGESASAEKIWGIAVVQEESFLSRKLIYDKARLLYRERYSIELSYDEFRWMRKHVKIYELYIIEDFMLYRRSILEALCRQEGDDGYDYNYSPIRIQSKKNLNSPSYNKFKHRITQKLNMILRGFV